MVANRRKPDSKTGLLTITEAANVLGVSVSTLRNWDKRGKFRPQRHPMNGYRLYKYVQLQALKKQITGDR